MKRQLRSNRFWGLLFGMMMGILPLHAQTDITIGAGSVTGTTSNGAATDAGPMYCTGTASSFVYSKHHMVYTASELTTAGIPPGVLITKIAWYKANNAAYSSAAASIFDIYLKNSSATGVPATPYAFATAISGATQAYTTTAQTFPSTIGWVDFTLPTPFLYTGGALELTTNWDISAGGATASGATANFAWAKDPGSNILSYVGASQNANFTNLRTSRAQIKITYMPAGPCVSPPNAGSTVISNHSPCFGQAITLNLNGATYGTGQTFQWEKATSISGPWTPEGSSSSVANLSGVIPLAGITYYRCQVTCGASTVASVIDSTNVLPPFPGGTYTINPSGSGANNFTSFAAAVSAINCGIAGPVIFNVSPGTYNEQITLPATINATSTNTVTFNGNGATLTDSIPVAGNNYATLRLDGADYITFKNLNIEARSASFGFAVHLSNNADWNTFDSCTISANITATATTTGAVVMSGAPNVYSTTGTHGSNNVFSNSTLSGGYFGFVSYGATVTGNQNNDVINCKVEDFYTYGIYYYQNTGGLVSQNKIERPTRTTVSTFYGIYAATGCTDMTIERNKVGNQFGGNPSTSGTCYMIYINSTAAGVGTENRVYNNQVSNINGNGTIYGLYLTGSINVQAYHNTISLDNAAATSGTAYGLYSTGTTNVDIQNNIINIAQGGTGTKYCLYFSGAGKTSNYNDLYMGSTGGTANHIGYYAANFTTLSAWQGANSNAWDQNSSNLDPMFATPSTWSCSPTNPFLDNLGTPLAAVATDINGVTRNITTPDMGAYEFSITTCSGTPSSAGTAVADVDSTCAGGPVELTLTGFPVAIGIGIQWEESYGSNIWTPISGATTPTYTATLLSTVSYRAAVNCNSGTSVYSNVVNVSKQDSLACYCSPFTGQTLHTNSANYITNVSIAGTSLNNPTSVVGPGGYTRNYPTTATTSDTLTQVVNYTLAATLSSSSYGAIAWIDYDHSRTYDIGESITLTNGVGTINIPVTALTGWTGMRVRAASNNTTYTAADACVNAATGYETEDYLLYIVPNIPCSGTPSTAGNASVNNDTLCVSGDVKLSLINFPLSLGISINWQWSPTGTNTFTDIPGATTDTFTVLGLNTSLDFRARVTCTNPGGGTIYSNVLNVVVLNPSFVTTVPGARCGTGPVTIAALPQAGVNTKWYDAAVLGNLLASGNVYTTPSISTTNTYYAEPVTGGGSKDSINVPLANGNTTGVYFHMFMLNTTTGLTLNSIGIKCNDAVNTLTSWDIYYRPNNYQLVSGANTSSSGWTLLSSVTNVPSMGNTTYTTIANNLNLSIPPGSTYSFHIAPVTGTHQYSTPSMGTTVASNANASIIAGHRGTLFNCTTTSGQATVNMGYTVGCIGTRVPVTATINGTGSGNGVAVGGTTVGSIQSNGTTVSYTDPSCNDTVAVVNSGTTNMGATSAIVLTSPSVLTFGGLPFVPRAYDIDPTTNGPATVTLYALQSEFTAYNSYVTSNSLSLPLLPTGPSDATGISHIVITQYHGDASAGTQGPFGLYSNANVEFIPNSAITVTPVGTTYWKMTFPVSGFSGFFIHSGSSPLDIKLASIAAANYGNRNRVDWTSADESHTAYYEIERSADAKVFAAVGRQTAKGKAGNYSYWDEAPLNGINYYRLKIYNANGNYSYSDVVKAFVSSGNAIMVEAYPNPVTDVLQVKVSGAQGQDAHLLLTDIAGKVIRRIDMSSAATTLSMSGMANGIYLLKYVDNRHQQTIRVTKQ